MVKFKNDNILLRVCNVIYLEPQGRMEEFSSEVEAVCQP
jgi:hypothetical protein